MSVARAALGSLALALCLFLSCLPAGAQAPAELYLEVTLNDTPTGAILRFTEGPRGLRSSVQNLRDLGLDPAVFGLQSEDDFDLVDARGLSADYDSALQALRLRVADALRAPLALSARSVRAVGPGIVSPGMVVNYSLYANAGGAERRTSLLSELRWFGRQGVISHTGIATLDGAGKRYLRLDTFWSDADPLTMVSRQAGDIISSSLGWNRSYRMGGVQLRRNFTLRPDLLTYPVAALGGSAVVPSTVSLYINGVQQLNADVPSGPFVLNQVAGINGAGQATIVTRDALGRSVSTSLPLYVDSRLLLPGLSDYAFELGALRRGYGTHSARYASSPAASASWRYGVNDLLTVEAHGEAGRSVVNAGGGALLRLGQAGVVNASLAASAGRNDGAQGSIGYQYVSPHYSVDLQMQRASRRYGDLGSLANAAPSRSNDRVSVNAALPMGQSIGLSLLSYRLPRQGAARVASLSYAATLRNGVYFSLNGFQDLKQRATRGVYAALNIAFGNRIAGGVSTARQNGDAVRGVTLARAPDFGGGFGWLLQRGDSGGQATGQAQLQYLGRAGQLTVFTQQAQGQRSTAADLNGALVLMDGTVAAARQVGSGFAMVATGVPDVPVVHENRRIGRTDAQGRLLVPNLTPYANNLITIDTSAMPADARVRTTRLWVVPQRLAGVVAPFPVERYSAATVILHAPDGTPLAVGTPVRHAGSGAESVVGYDGMAFIDELGADNLLQAGAGPTLCETRFSWRRTDDGSLATIGPLPCIPVKGAVP